MQHRLKSAVLLLKYLWVSLWESRLDSLISHTRKEDPRLEKTSLAFILTVSCFNQGCVLTVYLEPRAASGPAIERGHHQPILEAVPEYARAVGTETVVLPSLRLLVYTEHFHESNVLKYSPHMQI